MSDLGQLSPGTKVDRYELVKLIGSGGMGEVYMALHEFTKKTVALKVLKISHAAKEHHVEKMRAEAMVLCRIRHHNLIEVYDAGIADVATAHGTLPRIWMAMELLEGESLRERLMREGAVRPALALEWVAQCADGVQAAHDANVIHRDLKPENVFLTKKGDIRVLDFGTAKFEGFGHPATSTNDRVGTVPYMSPEHLGGEELDGRSDVYALGFILYEMLAGRHPFSDERGAFPPMDQLIGMVLGGEPDSLAHHVGEQVWQVVVRAIAKDKNHRFGSMAELAQACRSAAAAYGAQGTGALRLSGSSANMPVPAGASGSYAAMSQSGLSPLGQSGMGQSGLTPSPLTSSGVRPPVTGVTGGTLAGLGALAVVLGAAIVFLASPGKPGDDGAQAAPASSDNETTLVAPPSEPTGEAKTEPSATTEAKAATSASATAASGTPTASASVSAKVVRPPPPPPPPTATPITKPPPCVRNPDEPFPLPCPK